MTPTTLARVCLITALLAHTGCAYNGSMRRGDRAAAAGDPYQAWSEYNKAYETKATTEAADGMNSARQAALVRFQEDARVAVSQGDWPGAAEVVRKTNEVTDRNDPEGVKVRDIVGQGLANAIGSLLDAGRDADAYELGLQSVELFPSELFAEAAIDKVRSRFRTQAEELTAEAKYEEALAKLTIISDREPEWKEILALPEQQIREAWATHLGETARDQYRKGRHGAAAIYYARAYEVAGRADDLTTAKEIARDVKSDGELEHYLKGDGDWSRVKPMRDEIRAWLLEKQHVGRGGQSTSDLVVNFDLPKAYCSDSKEAAAKSLDYVAGQREVPNPEYASLSAEVEKVRAEKKRLADELRAATPDYEKSKAEMDALNARWEQANTDTEEATKALDRAKRQLDEQQKLVTKLEGDLAAAADADAREAVQVKIKAISKNVDQWKAEVDKWETKLAESSTLLAELTTEREPAAEAFARLESGNSTLTKEKAAVDKQLRDIEGRLLKVPATLMEDIPETMEYEVFTWTRTCKVPTYATAATGWRASAEKRLRLETETKAVDTAHVGNKQAGLKADEKKYPKTDEELIAEAEEANLTGMKAWADALVKDHFTYQTQRALDAMDANAHRGADLTVSLWVFAPDHLDEDSVKKIKAKVKDHYGLEKLELLREDEVATE